MRNSLFVFSVCMMTFSSVAYSADSNNPRFIEYSINEEEYAVIAIQEKGMSMEQARQFALKRVAQITVDKNLRYFVIETEGQVDAVNPSNVEATTPPPPHNLYEELYQSGDSEKEQALQDPMIPQQISPGFQIVFKCFATKPFQKSYDACELVSCKK